MARPRSDIAPRILHAARKRFLAEGVDGASLRGIAADADTGIGMVYYYYPTKDDLFFAAVEETYVKLMADLGEAVKADRPVEDRIQRIYRRISAISDEELLTVRLVLREVLADNHRLDGLVERFQRGHIPLIMATVLEGMQDGTIRTELPPAVALMVTLSLGAVPQLVRRLAGDRFPLGVVPRGADLADTLLGVWTRGVGPDAEPVTRAKTAGKKKRAKA